MGSPSTRGRRAVARPLASWGSEQIPDAREIEVAVALGEESVVTNAMEAVGQDVQRKASHELMRGEAHDAGAPAAAVVPVGEADFLVVDGKEPGIGDCRAMRVAGEIGEHALGSAERRLGVDDEGALAQRAHPLGEDGRIGKPGQIAEEAEFTAPEGCVQAFEEDAAERLRQRLYGQEEVRLAGDPALAVEGDAPAGGKTVDMRVMGERLSPSVQNGDQADLGAEAFGGERHERLGRRAHQQGIDRLLVLKGDLGRRRRQGEDDMEIGDRQQFGLPRRKPLRSRRALTFWTMAIAARNGRRPLRALWAKFVMVSERSRGRWV